MPSERVVSEESEDTHSPVSSERVVSEEFEDTHSPVPSECVVSEDTFRCQVNVSSVRTQSGAK